MSRIYKKTNFAGSDSSTGIAFGGGGGGGGGRTRGRNGSPNVYSDNKSTIDVARDKERDRKDKRGNVAQQSQRDMQYAAVSGCVAGGFNGAVAGFSVAGPAGAIVGGGLGCLGGATVGVITNEAHTRTKNSLFGSEDY